MEQSRSSDRSLQKQARIVEAARHVFLQDGFRGARMERIAREAGVAKATLYSYYPDKDAVFATVTKHVAGELETQFHKALGIGGKAWERIAAAVAAKHKTARRLLQVSPHADELYNSRPAEAAEHLQRLEALVEREVVRLLREEGHQQPVRFAAIFLAAAEGIAAKATQPEEIGPALRLLASHLLASPQIQPPPSTER